MQTPEGEIIKGGDWMENLIRRVSELERAVERCQDRCDEKITSINGRLENGSKIFTEHTIKITHLENWKLAQMGTIDDMRKDFNLFASEMRTEQQKAKNLMIGILSSLIVTVLALLWNVLAKGII